MADASSSSAPAAAEPVLRFRNYKPHSEEVQGAAVSIEKPALPDVEVIVNQTEVVHEDATQEPLLNLAPKRSANSAMSTSTWQNLPPGQSQRRRWPARPLRQPIR